ncbi:MAG: hypothetical protein Q4C98_11620 [Capnocytophaga sp.]|nr:hypothetical protein [Capnocytophaga sp.]
MKIVSYLSIVALLFVACSKDGTETPSDTSQGTVPATPSATPTPNSELTEVANFTNDDNHKISIKTFNGKLYVGYNDIYVTITDASGNVLKPEKITFSPMMRMYKEAGNRNEISFSHSCPHTADLASVSENRYRGYAIFQMNTGDTGHWDVSFSYTLSGKEYQIQEKEVTILAQPKNHHLKVKRFIGKDNATYILALISPLEHVNGKNPNVVAGLFKAETMMSFPLVKGFTLNLDPRMPGADMRNHSTPFEDFKEQADGFHTATINYSMTGYWELNFIIKNSSGEVIAGTEVPKTPKTPAEYDAVSELSLRIDIER